MNKDRDNDNSINNELTRRELGKISLAAGIFAVSGVTSASAALQTVESDVQIKTPDGICDAAFIHPASGSYPGVIIWTDAFGLRPTFREMGKRLAAEGYAVLVPNPYYRSGKAPMGEGLDFANPADKAKFMELMKMLTQDSVHKDALAYVAFLDSQASVRKTALIGTSGYCMGGRLTMITAAAASSRIGAGGSFHGGNLVTEKTDSPHLLVPKMKAKYYFGISEDDDKKQPDAKDKLKSAFAEAKLPAEIKVYEGAHHGWCVPDMPARDGHTVYDQTKAEIAWTKLLELFKTTLG